jgi:hypothetical protein
MRRRIAAYNKPGFHPHDHDNAELLAKWSAELFGTDGRLAENLR